MAKRITLLRLRSSWFFLASSFESVSGRKKMTVTRTIRQIRQAAKQGM